MNIKITLPLLTLIAALGFWSYAHYTQAVEGKTYREWHQLRTDNFKEIRKSFSPIDEMAKGHSSFQPNIVKKYALKLNNAASDIPALFEPAAPWGEASEAIWETNSDFKAKLNQFIASTQDLAQNVPKAGSDLRQRVELIRQQCIDCHRSYKD